MNPETAGRQVVFTHTARCRDCYRCVRICPVKAIRMENAQASVVDDRCVACGTCIRECPQGAKGYRQDLARARRLVQAGGVVAASVAPSFAGIFPGWRRGRLPNALRKLGFTHVAETAAGAWHVSRRLAELAQQRPDQPHVCTACPSVVRYVQRYAPHCTGWLTPIVSPMIAHARSLRARLGEGAKVVFIGPCVAKKAEADRPEHAGEVDCVLTFEELQAWMEQEGVDLTGLEESGFDETPGDGARAYPLAGGAVRTADLPADLLAPDVVTVTGHTELAEALESLRPAQGLVLEPMFCPQGCINGPAAGASENLFERRRSVLEYVHQTRRDDAPRPAPAGGDALDLAAAYRGQIAPAADAVGEDQVRRVLEKTGKAADADQLNCGACGYSTCRDKAVAVLRGLAEVEMCIPYMRRLAERRTDRIMETSPNGIVILDERLGILGMNEAFRRFFMCSESVLGKPIGYLVDPDPFERVATGLSDRIETLARHERYNLVCHQIIYALREERQVVGIFVNVTGARASQEKLRDLREQTLDKARELLGHQVRMAQQMADFLGHSTAQGEEIVETLMQLAQDEQDVRDAHAPADGRGGEKRDWLRSIYTSK